MSCRVVNHARTELVFQDPGTGWIPPSPLVQFKLYQGEVLPYNPGTRDWVESTQSETPEAPTQSEMVKLITGTNTSGVGSVTGSRDQNS